MQIRHPALYPGEYTAEPIPEYQPKGYAAELAECQRYYFSAQGNCVGIAHPYEATDAYVTIFTPTKLRAISSIGYNNLRIANGNYILENCASINSISNTKINQNNISFFAHTQDALSWDRIYDVCSIGIVDIVADL